MNIQPADVMNYKLNVKNYLHKISVVNNKKFNIKSFKFKNCDNFE